jgi:hypothetical protein
MSNQNILAPTEIHCLDDFLTHDIPPFSSYNGVLLASEKPLLYFLSVYAAGDEMLCSIQINAFNKT